MFVLWIGCVLQFNLVESTQQPPIERKPQELLQMSLHHVNALLAEIDKKIEKERQLLSQLDGKAALDAVVSKMATKKPGDPKIADIVAEWAKHNPVVMYPEPDFDSKVPRQQPTRRPSSNDPGERHVQRQGTVAVTPIAAEVPTPQDPIGDLPVDVEPEEIPGLPPGWPFNEETTTLSTTTVVNVTVSNPTLKDEMLAIMTKLNVGYCYAAMVGLNDVMAKKDLADLGALVDALSKTINRMADQGKLDVLGQVLIKRIKLIWIWTSLLTPEIIQTNARGTQTRFRHKNALPDDIDGVFKEYDSLFTQQDGEQMLNEVIKIEMFNFSQHGSETAELLVEGLLQTLITPANRNRDSFHLKAMIAKANRAYTNRYPDYRRSEIFNALDAITDFETMQTPDTRRRMSRSSRHIKTKHKKLLRHLISKHPTLFDFISKHYHRSSKRKHHHSKWKKHHNRHHYGRQRHRHHHHNEYENIQTTTSQRIEQEILTQSTLQIPNFRERTTRSNYMYALNQKRYSVVSERTGLSKRISPSILTRRAIYNRGDNSKQRLNKIISNRLKLSKLSDVTEKLQGRKALDKIVRESSNSNEEKYLRTMLYDAFYHGNDTFSNWTGKNQTNLIVAPSDTDEEWIFKSNIYKVFQQTQN